MAVNGTREIKKHLKMILFPKCSLSWDCAFEYEAARITAVASRKLQTEAVRTPGLSKAKSTTAFMQWWLWQVEPLIPDHRIHSSTVPKHNREGFWPSPGSRRVRNPHWPRCRHTGLAQEGRGERGSRQLQHPVHEQKPSSWGHSISYNIRPMNLQQRLRNSVLRSILPLSQKRGTERNDLLFSFFLIKEPTQGYTQLKTGSEQHKLEKDRDGRINMIFVQQLCFALFKVRHRCS